MTMHFDWSTWALQTVNFAILVWLLHRFLYRPVLRLLDARRAEIDKQYAEAHMAEARRAALDLGTDIAGRLLDQVPIKLCAEAWLARIEEHLAALPQTEKDVLARQLVDGAQLTVVTATALSAEANKIWRARLQKTFGDRVAIGFDTDRHLVAGAELHFPSAVLRFSWQSALAQIRAEIAGDGDAR